MTGPAVTESNPLEVLRQWDQSPIDETTLGVIIGATSDTYAQQRGLGKTTQDLVDLHRLVRSACSDRYHDLREASPDASKEEINAEPKLVALNSVRRTLHQAMERRHNEVYRKRRYGGIKHG